MIEKVARAITDTCVKQGIFVDVDYVYWQNELARAAIAAMREPTEAMTANIRPSLLPDQVWQAMIDAALKEK